MKNSTVVEEIVEELIQEIGYQVTRDYEGKGGIWEGMSISNVKSRDKALHALSTLEAQIREEKINENTSDGYHTFKELYEFRLLYNAGLFNDLARNPRYKVHKSKKHHDGEDCSGGGWFIVMATLPTGQISNHYELKDWDLFHCHEQKVADTWDGHTSQDVAKRLREWLTPHNPLRAQEEQ
jgi:hypothetical protein